MIQNVHRSPREVTFFPVRFEWKLNILNIFNTSSNIKFHENSSSGTELFHVDRQTDMTKLIVASRNFADVPKNATTAPDGYSGKVIP